MRFATAPARRRPRALARRAGGHAAHRGLYRVSAADTKRALSAVRRLPGHHAGHAALDPEKLRGIEAGIDLAPAAGLSLELTAFHNRLGGAIANVTIGPNLRQRQNVCAIVARGIEVTARARRGAVSLDASYALSDARVNAPGLALDGFAPAQSPRHAASATIAYARPGVPAMSVTARHVGKQYEDDLQADALPAAPTVDVVAQVSFGRALSLVARAENLFDAPVFTRNQAGSVDLGAPRIFWIGIKYAR